MPKKERQTVRKAFVYRHLVEFVFGECLLYVAEKVKSFIHNKSIVSLNIPPIFLKLSFTNICKIQNFVQAKAITDYRRLHGKINSLQDLRFSPDFTEADIQRLVPYVEY